MKHLFVGDIHGDVEVVRNVLRFADGRHVVFLGDFLDSFRFGKKDQIESLLAAMKAARSGKATLITANHEVSYLDVEQRCAGWNAVMDSLVLPHQHQLRSVMKPFLLLRDPAGSRRPLLVTHAGVTSQLWSACGLTVERLEEALTEASRDSRSWFYSTGRARGGLRPFGGPLWCDWNHEFTPVSEITQVVGHTGDVGVPYGFRQKLLSGIRCTAKNFDFNVDCLQSTSEILEYDHDAGFAVVCRVDAEGIHHMSSPVFLK